MTEKTISFKTPIQDTTTRRHRLRNKGLLNCKAHCLLKQQLTVWALGGHSQGNFSELQLPQLYLQHRMSLCAHTHTQRATDRGYLHLYGLHHNRCVLNNPIEHIMPLNTHNTPNQQVGKYCTGVGAEWKYHV